MQSCESLTEFVSLVPLAYRGSCTATTVRIRLAGFALALTAIQTSFEGQPFDDVEYLLFRVTNCHGKNAATFGVGFPRLEPFNQRDWNGDNALLFILWSPASLFADLESAVGKVNIGPCGIQCFSFSRSCAKQEPKQILLILTGDREHSCNLLVAIR